MGYFECLQLRMIAEYRLGKAF